MLRYNGGMDTTEHSFRQVDIGQSTFFGMDGMYTNGIKTGSVEDVHMILGFVPPCSAKDANEAYLKHETVECDSCNGLYEQEKTNPSIECPSCGEDASTNKAVDQ